MIGIAKGYNRPEKSIPQSLTVSSIRAFFLDVRNSPERKVLIRAKRMKLRD